MSLNCPTRKEPYAAAFCKHAGLVVGLLVVQLAGCAAFQLPSYRVNELSATGQQQVDDAEFGEGEMVDESCDESVEGECAEDTLDALYWPTLPTPRFIKRWKEHKELPEGPKGIRFHPLPTKPMFQARSNPGLGPTSERVALDCAGAMGVNYGVLPQGQRWHPAKPTMSPAINTDAAQSLVEEKQQSVQLLQPKPAPSLSNSRPPSIDELPQPETSGQR